MGTHDTVSIYRSPNQFKFPTDSCFTKLDAYQIKLPAIQSFLIVHLNCPYLFYNILNVAILEDRPRHIKAAIIITLQRIDIRAKNKTLQVRIMSQSCN